MIHILVERYNDLLAFIKVLTISQSPVRSLPANMHEYFTQVFVLSGGGRPNY